MTALVTEPERLPQDSSLNNCFLFNILRSYCPTFRLSQLFTSVFLLSSNKWKQFIRKFDIMLTVYHYVTQ
jgi:hypothetical protein